ncbi:MAG: TetR/AcrR family transcriptional regulator [Okeania sp. SIO3H1]|uniref:TetR/AcrR family transcriptional regulator n=1 Tax=Okeania sp. SIO1I7 TaxID=2607772 RepID=UPI0013CB3147|nr:TetR/AcrR family transcriptional regulator [Okeania sp. SIO1I7]NEN89013.1 TetR/AcrR family transcriptional regulator [Okeania sp. SIO3H1]NET27951.1 TetR/AcrR family transcriptional regulator [Okeania sp. SIO1I7]
MKSSNHPRQQILETASQLFYQKGIQNVGINEIIATSGVAKRTLYRHFTSKDELIEAVMKHRATEWLNWFEMAVRDRGNTAKERLLATFDILREWYASPNFRGCPFINAVLEIADASHPAHDVSVGVRESIRMQIKHLAEEVGVTDAESFSQQYLLLIGGASLMATIEGFSGGANYAQQALSTLIDSSIGKSKI